MAILWYISWTNYYTKLTHTYIYLSGTLKQSSNKLKLLIDQYQSQLIKTDSVTAKKDIRIYSDLTETKDKYQNGQF